MNNVIDLNSRRAARVDAGSQTTTASDKTHLANAADAVRTMLRAYSEQVAAEGTEAARHQLAAAALALLGPGWALHFDSRQS